MHTVEICREEEKEEEVIKTETGLNSFHIRTNVWFSLSHTVEAISQVSTDLRTLEWESRTDKHTTSTVSNPSRSWDQAQGANKQSNKEHVARGKLAD